MGELSKIEWTDHTFNPWIGCTKITGGCEGSACDFCYAETLVHRYGWAKWGAGEPRARTSEANWKKPLTWNRKAAKEGRRFRVFCASLADVFDAEVLQEWRGDLFDVIKATPHLDWQLLTKRPQVALKFFSDRPDVQGLPNVWLGTTVESQKMADLRIPTLLSVPGVAKRFLSCEPLLGPVDLAPWLSDDDGCGGCDDGPPPRCGRTDIPRDEQCPTARAVFVTHEKPVEGRDYPDVWVTRTTLDWVIAGGESGPKARPSHPDWFRALRDQCVAAGVPFFFKQWGEWTPGENVARTKGTVETATWFDREWSFDREDLANEEGHVDDQPDLYRVGKKAAGAELDGKLHREFPT